MMNKYKRWKESTSTSPSGRHLGHFHALFRPLKAKNDEDRERSEGIRLEIIELHAITLQNAYDNEHVYIQMMGVHPNMHVGKRYRHTKDTQTSSSTFV
jgi:hypothetical protein